MPLAIPQRMTRRVLFFAAALVSLLGLISELLHYVAQLNFTILGLFSLSLEGNLPTWYSSLLLFACGLALHAVAAGARQQSAPFRHRWALLGCIFMFMSLDEAVELHEQLGRLVKLHGVLYFSWVVPASVIVILLGLAYLPFLVHLPARTRWRFVIAGALYVGGALLLELPLGYWAERAGTENLTYVLIDWVEESLEIFGATLFLSSLFEYLGEKHGALQLAPSEAG
jgi:hypothetical protein